MKQASLPKAKRVLSVGRAEQKVKGAAKHNFESSILLNLCLLPGAVILNVNVLRNLFYPKC